MFEILIDSKQVRDLPKWTAGQASIVGYGGAGVIVGDYYYVSGGYNGGALSSFVRCHLGTMTPAVNLRSLPEGYGYHRTEHVDGKIYLYGGWKGGFVSTIDLLIYDIANDSWTRGPNGPYFCREGASCVVDKSIYFLDTGSTLLRLMVFNTLSGIWEDSVVIQGYSDMGAQARMVVFDGSIYIFPGTKTADMVVYNPVSKTSYQIPASSERRQSGIPFVFDGDIYYWSGCLPTTIYPSIALTMVSPSNKQWVVDNPSEMTEHPSSFTKGFASDAHSSKWVAASGGYASSSYLMFALLN